MKTFERSLILSLFFVTIVCSQFVNEKWTISNDSIAYILHSNGSYESVENNPLFYGGIMITGLQGNEVKAFFEYNPGLRLNGVKPGKYETSQDDPPAGIYVAYSTEGSGTASYEAWRDAVLLGAPYHDFNDDGIYDPDIDLPLLFGDLQTWMVYSTDESEQRVNNPLALEVQQFNWMYRFGKLRDVLFFKYIVTNKSDAPIDSALFSLAMDPDIGDYGDDLLGSDTLLNMQYVYNSGDDSQYGGAPPALGCIVMSADLQRLFSATFFYFALHYNYYDDLIRNLQSGRTRFGETFDPTSFGVGADEHTNPLYLFSGDPLSGSGWLDDIANDKRMLASVFAKALLPEESFEFYAALVLGKGNSPLNSVSLMRENAAKALQAIRGGFKRADPPPAAGLEAIPGDKSVDLMIDLSDCYDYEEEDVLGNHYLFEGFALYQLAHADAEVGDPEQSRLIARYDLDNTYKDIYRLNDVGISEQVWDGQNNIGGLSADSNIVTHTVNMDAFSGKPINNFSRYHFTVRTFSLNYAALQPFDQTDEIENDWYAPRSFDIQFSPVAVQVAVLAGDDTEAVLDRVEAVPNPYFPGQGYNGAVRFIHLPQGAVIRIFDVAGRPVRSMTHTLEQPFWDWDLRNDAGRRVAGGIYLIHVSKSASGSRILKLAVVGEKK